MARPAPALATTAPPAAETWPESASDPAPEDAAWLPADDVPPWDSLDDTPVEPQATPALQALPVLEAAPPAASRTELRKRPVVPLQTTPEGDVWFALVQQLVQAEAITALVRELALQSQLLARDSDTWMLRIERESLNNPTSRERLQTALAAAGHPVRLAIEVGRVADSPALRLAQAAAQRQSQAEAIIHNDPYVQTLMRDFGARIVPGSIKPV